MIPRALTRELHLSASELPVIALTGPRQSGKTTLAKACFPDFEYVSMENPDTRRAFNDDPRYFLSRYHRHIIFDEAQRTPQLFSYLQQVVDETNEPGQFVLTGSQNFLLLDTISQTLAGRVAVRHLLPLSYSEVLASDADTERPDSIEEWVFRGGYPRLYGGSTIRTVNFYEDYLRTYVERDVRKELGVRKLTDYTRFVKYAAHQCGKSYVASDFANECGVSRITVNDWMSILESSFVAFRMLPYYKNYGKRLVKMPKLYFYDTGLACNLQGIESPMQLRGGDAWGNLFENAVVVEIIKQYYMHGREPRLYYWRDNRGMEIDFVIEKSGKPQYVIEVKASSTYDVHAWATIDKMADSMGVDTEHRLLVYSGADSFDTRHGRVLRLQDLASLEL
ncbi:MAG: ATP-binding protein [Bifidobacteriaceae bacterium]|nr:ATP-binding protein [Bifidobacteriaceae bacterium]